MEHNPAKAEETAAPPATTNIEAELSLLDANLKLVYLTQRGDYETAEVLVNQVRKQLEETNGKDAPEVGVWLVISSQLFMQDPYRTPLVLANLHRATLILKNKPEYVNYLASALSTLALLRDGEEILGVSYSEGFLTEAAMKLKESEQADPWLYIEIITELHRQIIKRSSRISLRNRFDQLLSKLDQPSLPPIYAINLDFYRLEIAKSMLENNESQEATKYIMPTMVRVFPSLTEEENESHEYLKMYAREIQIDYYSQRRLYNEALQSAEDGIKEASNLSAVDNRNTWRKTMLEAKVDALVKKEQFDEAITLIEEIVEYYLDEDSSELSFMVTEIILNQYHPYFEKANAHDQWNDLRIKYLKVALENFGSDNEEVASRIFKFSSTPMLSQNSKDQYQSLINRAIDIKREKHREAQLSYANTLFKFMSRGTESQKQRLEWIDEIIELKTEILGRDHKEVQYLLKMKRETQNKVALEEGDYQFIDECWRQYKEGELDTKECLELCEDAYFAAYQRQEFVVADKWLKNVQECRLALPVSQRYKPVLGPDRKFITQGRVYDMQRFSTDMSHYNQRLKFLAQLGRYDEIPALISEYKQIIIEDLNLEGEKIEKHFQGRAQDARAIRHYEMIHLLGMGKLEELRNAIAALPPLNRGGELPSRMAKQLPFPFTLNKLTSPRTEDAQQILNVIRLHYFLKNYADSQSLYLEFKTPLSNNLETKRDRTFAIETLGILKLLAVSCRVRGDYDTYKKLIDEYAIQSPQFSYKASQKGIDGLVEIIDTKLDQQKYNQAEIMLIDTIQRVELTPDLDQQQLRTLYEKLALSLTKRGENDLADSWLKVESDLAKLKAEATKD